MPLSAHPLAHTLVHSFRMLADAYWCSARLPASADPETEGPSPPHTAALVCSEFKEPSVCVSVCVRCVLVCMGGQGYPSGHVIFPCPFHVSPHSCPDLWTANAIY